MVWKDSYYKQNNKELVELILTVWNDKQKHFQKHFS